MIRMKHEKYDKLRTCKDIESFPVRERHHYLLDSRKPKDDAAVGDQSTIQFREQVAFSGSRIVQTHG